MDESGDVMLVRFAADGHCPPDSLRTIYRDGLRSDCAYPLTS